MRTPDLKETFIIDFEETIFEFSKIQNKDHSLITDILLKISIFAYLFSNIINSMIPKYPSKIRKGGIVSLRECGKGEIVNFPDGNAIIPNDIAENIAKSNNNINFKVDLKDTTDIILDKIDKDFKGIIKNDK